MKKFLCFLLFFCSNFIIAQATGIGNKAPRGALDINKPTTNDAGLVLPTNSTPVLMVNPQGGGYSRRYNYV